jgi:signal transduction histidine kinase
VRTGEEVIEEQVTTSARFSTDPYVTANSVRSAMCLPIKRASVVAGIIYLENNLTVGAFTRQRASFVRALSVQAIISIDNARLYESLEEHSRTLQQRVEERTRELHLKNQELVDTQEQLVAQQKLASLGVLTGGIAHELKNPLNFVNNFSELSTDLADELASSFAQQRHRLDPKVAAEMEELVSGLSSTTGKILEHGQRATQIIDGMLLHARSSRGTPAPADLNALLADAVSLARRGTPGNARGFEVAAELECDATIGLVDVVSADMSRVFINLLNNAYYALEHRRRAAGSGFVPVLRVRSANRGDRVEVRIFDNGGGIPSAILKQVWNPFFTTKPAGEGTGLGLSISHDIVVGMHSGAMSVESVEGEHTEFLISLPKRWAAYGAMTERARAQSPG